MRLSGGASRWRVCYQRGRPRLVFLSFLVCIYMRIFNSYITVFYPFEVEFYDHVDKSILPKQLNLCETSTGVSRIFSRPTKCRTVLSTVLHIAQHKCALCKTRI